MIFTFLKQEVDFVEVILSSTFKHILPHIFSLAINSNKLLLNYSNLFYLRINLLKPLLLANTRKIIHFNSHVFYGSLDQVQVFRFYSRAVLLIFILIYFILKSTHFVFYQLKVIKFGHYCWNKRTWSSIYLYGYFFSHFRDVCGFINVLNPVLNLTQPLQNHIISFRGIFILFLMALSFAHIIHQIFLRL